MICNSIVWKGKPLFNGTGVHWLLYYDSVQIYGGRWVHRRDIFWCFREKVKLVLKILYKNELSLEEKVQKIAKFLNFRGLTPSDCKILSNNFFCEALKERIFFVIKFKKKKPLEWKLWKKKRKKCPRLSRNLGWDVFFPPKFSF